MASDGGDADHEEAAKDFLDARVNRENPSEKEEKAPVLLDLAPFRRKMGQLESAAAMNMFEGGHRDLIKHPVVEAFIHLKVRIIVVGANKKLCNWF